MPPAQDLSLDSATSSMKKNKNKKKSYIFFFFFPWDLCSFSDPLQSCFLSFALVKRQNHCFDCLQDSLLVSSFNNYPTKQTNKSFRFIFFFDLVLALCLPEAFPRAQQVLLSPLGPLVSRILVGPLASQNHLVSNFPLVVLAACEGPCPFTLRNISI